MLAATLVITACTGCSNSKQTQAPGTTTTSTRPARLANQSRWAKQVDAACKPWQGRIDAVTPAPVDVASLQVWLGRALPLVRKQIAAVEAVPPPEKQVEARKVALFLESLQKTERALTRYLSAIRKNAPAKERRALAEASAGGAAARGYAASLDITQCGGYSSG